jgi:outer membrane protein assembly factor BamB
MSSLHLRLLNTCALFGVVISASANDWPVLGRDKTRNAVSPEKNAPVEWDIKTGRNIKWTAPLGTYCFSDPVVSQGLVWVGTNNEEPDGQAPTEYAAVLRCFREDDGKVLSQHAWPALKGPLFRLAVVGFACSPLIEESRMYFTSTRGEVVCWDIAALKDRNEPPKEIWKTDLIEEFGVYPRMPIMGDGKTCSIAASYRDWIYVVTGNGRSSWDRDTGAWRNYMPAPDAPSLICFDKRNGKVVWTDQSPGTNVLFGQWASPLVIEINGRAQVITPQGDGWVRAFEAETGRLIWRFDINLKSGKWPMSRDGFMATPVFYDNRIYIGSGRDRESGEGPGRLCCLDPTKQGDISLELDSGPGQGKPNPNSGAVWHFDDIGRMHSNVAVQDGLVIAAGFNGFIYCLDARTGQIYWKHDMRAHVEPTPLIVDSKIYLADEDGEVCILALSREKRKIGEHTFPEPIYASPIFANGVFYVATTSHLYAIQQK